MWGLSGSGVFRTAFSPSHALGHKYILTSRLDPPRPIDPSTQPIGTEMTAAHSTKSPRKVSPVAWGAAETIGKAHGAARGILSSKQANLHQRRGTPAPAAVPPDSEQVCLAASPDFRSAVFAAGVADCRSTCTYSTVHNLPAAVGCPRCRSHAFLSWRGPR